MPIGIVSEFASDRGLGGLTLDDGNRVIFHATAIADGSRSIEVGTRVSCTVAATHGGGVQAIEVAKI